MKHLKTCHPVVAIVFVVVMLSALMASAPAIAQQPPQAGAQDGYVPVKSLPSGQVQETLPAAPLVVAAYAFVWAVLVVYLWFIWRRLGKVQADIAALERRVRKA